MLMNVYDHDEQSEREHFQRIPRRIFQRGIFIIVIFFPFFFFSDD